MSFLVERLWGARARFAYLFFASAILLFACLGGRDIWTQEHRWANIVSGMFYRHDFFHPYLSGAPYYDKPLLSYWLMAGLSFITGSLNTLTLRLPSALAGLLAIWSIYRLGTRLQDRRLGLLSGWLLLTTFYFLFWARVASADMLNLAGALFAVAWYMDHKHTAAWSSYAIFFLIVALTSLCKGPVAAVIVFIAVAVDIFLENTWRKHLHLTLFLSMIPAVILYVSPFLLSNYFGGEQYGESGLYMVYRENILRFFHPFDHQDPIYTYFIYLPLYVVPWVIFFIPAVVQAVRVATTRRYASNAWLPLTTLLLFIFFTLSGSRRNYYILPLVPFAILMTASWLLHARACLQKITALLVVTAYLFLFVFVDFIPAWYDTHYGASAFSALLQQAVHPHSSVMLLDSQSKLIFYLHLPPDIKQYDVMGDRSAQTSESLLLTWPFLKNIPPHTIFVTRQAYQSLLSPYFKDFSVVELPAPPYAWMQINTEANPIAFVPNPKKGE